MKKTYLTIIAFLIVSQVNLDTQAAVYRKAYDEAMGLQQSQYQTIPLSPTTATNTSASTTYIIPQQPKTTQAATNTTTTARTPVRSENVQLISGSGLKEYSVVVGSFGVLSNAENLRQRLVASGYNAQIVRNTNTNMYRVVASTYNNREEAFSNRNFLKTYFNGAWVLKKGQTATTTNTNTRTVVPVTTTSQTRTVKPVQQQTVAKTATTRTATVPTATTKKTITSYVPMRTEYITGPNVNNYSVVVGSFGVRQNALNLQQRLINAGYNAQIVRLTDKNLYCVLFSTHSDLESAVQNRNAIKAYYPDAWILETRQ